MEWLSYLNEFSDRERHWVKRGEGGDIIDRVYRNRSLFSFTKFVTDRVSFPNDFQSIRAFIGPLWSWTPMTNFDKTLGPVRSANYPLPQLVNGGSPQGFVVGWGCRVGWQSYSLIIIPTMIPSLSVSLSTFSPSTRPSPVLFVPTPYSVLLSGFSFPQEHQGTGDTKGPVLFESLKPFFLNWSIVSQFYFIFHLLLYFQSVYIRSVHLVIYYSSFLCRSWGLSSWLFRTWFVVRQSFIMCRETTFLYP